MLCNTLGGVSLGPTEALVGLATTLGRSWSRMGRIVRKPFKGRGKGLDFITNITYCCIHNYTINHNRRETRLKIRKWQIFHWLTTFLFFFSFSLSRSLSFCPRQGRWGGPEETESGKRVCTETAIVPGVDCKWIRGPLLYCFQFFVLITLHTVLNSYLDWGSLVERPLKLGLVLFSMMSS